MLAYIGVNGAGLPAAAAFAAAVAQAVTDNYQRPDPGQTLTVSDPAKGVIANDINIYGVQLLGNRADGTVPSMPNGTFTYTQRAARQTRSHIARTAPRPYCEPAMPPA